MPARVDRLLSWCTLVDVSPAVLRGARRLASASLRMLDAIHLATALSTSDALAGFVTYDARLARAATAARLEVFQPE